MVLAEIISRWTFFINAILTFAIKYFNVLDDSIGLITGLLAVAGGILWISTVTIKRKRERIEKEIADTELKIKKIELENLELQRLKK